VVKGARRHVYAGVAQLGFRRQAPGSAKESNNKTNRIMSGLERRKSTAKVYRRTKKAEDWREKSRTRTRGMAGRGAVGVGRLVGHAEEAGTGAPQARA
jgi:hypothetical protein